MLAPASPLGDPLTNQCDLSRLQRLAVIRRRHEIISIIRGHTIDEFATIRIAGDYRTFAGFQFSPGTLFIRQVQPGLLLVRPMASDAILRKNGLNIAREIDLCRTNMQSQKNAEG